MRFCGSSSDELIEYYHCMRDALINFSAAILFFATALRDWFWPGKWQISNYRISSFDEPLVWVALGMVCAGAAFRSWKMRSQRNVL